MRLFIFILISVGLLSCSEQSSETTTNSDKDKSVEENQEDSTNVEASLSDTLLTITDANRHKDDYLETEIHLSQGEVKISKNGEILHVGMYAWSDDSLQIQLKDYPYHLAFKVDIKDGSAYQLSDNHGLILQTTFENPNL